MLYQEINKHTKVDHGFSEVCKVIIGSQIIIVRVVEDTQFLNCSDHLHNQPPSQGSFVFIRKQLAGSARYSKCCRRYFQESTSRDVGDEFQKGIRRERQGLGPVVA